MQESAGVKDGWLRFCVGVSEGRVEEFDDIVSQEAKLVIGTAPGEFVNDRAGMRFGFETEGVTLESRNVRAYEEGTLGFSIDETTLRIPRRVGIRLPRDRCLAKRGPTMAARACPLLCRGAR
jgi:hypothetical protein